MKVKLIFDTENIDQSKELKTIMQASNMASVLFELVHNLKKKCLHKVEDVKFNNNPDDAVDLVFDEIMNLVEEHNLLIDHL
ncbi:MAG: hypothetical protein U9Q83_00075 [Bacteroidota bacterium]|nr:hypothetical protein [Bacteroidota bacterium]